MAGRLHTVANGHRKPIGQAWRVDWRVGWRLLVELFGITGFEEYGLTVMLNKVTDEPAAAKVAASLSIDIIRYDGQIVPHASQEAEVLE